MCPLVGAVGGMLPRGEQHHNVWSPSGTTIVYCMGP